jgi:DNA replication protein DnaC
MNELTLTKMKQMKLYGMHGAFKTAVETGRTDHYTIDQFVSMLTDAEWDERHNRRIDRIIRNAKFHYKSSIESIIFDQSRNLERNVTIRATPCFFMSWG